MRTRQKQLAGLTAALLAVAGLLLLRGDASKAASARAPDHDLRPAGADLAAAGSGPALAPDRDPRGMLGSETTSRHLEAYKRAAVYPIWSRPHDVGSQHLLHWNRVAGSDLGFDDTPGQELYYRFEADKNHVDFGEALTTWIDVHRQDGTRVPFDVVEAHVKIMRGPRQGQYLDLRYHDDGKDGDLVAADGVASNRFVPSQHAELGELEVMDVIARVRAGGKEKGMERSFSAAPRPVLDIVAMSEAVEGGSLTVTLDVLCFEAGGYNFQANLVTAQGEAPVAWLDIHHKLVVGRQQVKLVFFGKAIRDVGQAGSYVVRDLRGYLSLFDPDLTLWWSDARTLVTRSYRLEDFSSAEWDDDEKRARIANYESSIVQAREHELYGTGTPSRRFEVRADGTVVEVPATP